MDILYQQQIIEKNLALKGSSFLCHRKCTHSARGVQFVAIAIVLSTIPSLPLKKREEIFFHFYNENFLDEVTHREVVTVYS